MKKFFYALLVSVFLVSCTNKEVEEIKIENEIPNDLEEQNNLWVEVENSKLEESKKIEESVWGNDWIENNKLGEKNNEEAIESNVEANKYIDATTWASLPKPE